MSNTSYTTTQVANIPPELRALDQWANWHGDKVIQNWRTGRDGSSTNPRTWSTFKQAIKANPDRMVFVFRRDDGLAGIDLDHCRNAETGELEPSAQDVVDRFPHAYWEISVSGGGLHGIGYGTLPTETSGWHPAGTGAFHHSRYFVMTGDTLPGYETLGDFGDDLADWCRETFPPDQPIGTAPPANLTLEDQDIIDRLRRQNDGGMAGRLLDGDLCDFPSSSEARFSLATRACFYSDNPDQIARILRSSDAWSAKDRDRDRKSAHDAKQCIAKYDGERYTPGVNTGVITFGKDRSANGQHDDAGDDHDDDRRPEIDAGNQDLEVTSSLAWQALQRSNDPPRLLRFGGIPVRIEGDDDDVPVAQTLTEDRLSHELARCAQWFKVQKGFQVPASPPTRVVRDMLAAPTYSLPSLLSIVQAPVFAPNGSLQTEPGYHEAGRSFYAPASGFTVPTVPESPTDEDVEQAKALIIDDMLGEFSFVTDAELANTVSLLLDPFIRSLIDGPTPLRLIEAPTPGSGKGLLADVVLRAAIGSHVTLMTAPSGDDEFRKRITAQLSQLPAAILIDNVTTALDSGSLAGALTATWWSDRRLGVNEMIRVPVRCVWIATANNPTMSTEIARRTVRIRLDPKVDRPWKRTGFRHEDLRGWADEHRPEIVCAVLTLIQSWVSAGQPLGKARLGSFEKWAAVHSGILDHLGIKGFLGNLDEFYETADIEGAVWRQFVDLWFAKFNETEVGVSDLFGLAQDVEGFDFGQGSERAQKTSFGMALGRQRDRVIGDCRVTQTRTVQRVKRWRLVKGRPGGNPFAVFHELEQGNEAGNDRHTR
jgi:hypothetical protein